MNSTISLNVLSAKLKEHNYDRFFTRDELRLLFEKLVRNSDDGEVSVRSLELIVGDNEQSNHNINKDIQLMSHIDDIKHNIHKQVLEQRNNQRLEVSRKAVISYLIYICFFSL